MRPSLSLAASTLISLAIVPACVTTPAGDGEVVSSTLANPNESGKEDSLNDKLLEAHVLGTLDWDPRGDDGKLEGEFWVDVEEPDEVWEDAAYDVVRVEGYAIQLPTRRSQQSLVLQIENRGFVQGLSTKLGFQVFRQQYGRITPLRCRTSEGDWANYFHELIIDSGGRLAIDDGMLSQGTCDGGVPYESESLRVFPIVLENAKNLTRDYKFKLTAKCAGRPCPAPGYSGY